MEVERREMGGSGVPWAPSPVAPVGPVEVVTVAGWAAPEMLAADHSQIVLVVE